MKMSLNFLRSLIRNKEFLALIPEKHLLHIKSNCKCRCNWSKCSLYIIEELGSYVREYQDQTEDKENKYEGGDV